MNKNIDLSSLKGIGEVRLNALSSMGITTKTDLLMRFPKSYPSNRLYSPADENAFGECRVFRLTAATVPATFYKGGMKTTRFTAACRSCIDLPEGCKAPVCPLMENGICKKAPRVNVLFFNNPYIKNTIRKGETYTFIGVLKREASGLFLLCPRIDDSLDLTADMRTVYPVKKPLTSKLYSSLVSQIRDEIPSLIEETIPEKIRERFSLPERCKAVEELHFPTSTEALENARRRMAFEQLYEFARTSITAKRERQKKLYPAMEKVDFGSFVKALGFEMTSGQKKAVTDILGDIYGDGRTAHPMDRLLQGDVGSGKTAVAFSAAYAVLKNSMNVMMMAPTEILASQHYEKAKKLFEPLGIECILVTASVKKAQREEIEEKCKAKINGNGVFLIGTHALITDKTKVSDVGLVITDEQHRFGVVQREKLRDKSLIPHTLMMSATPIPRTLAMFFYSAGNVSVLGELPSGRKPIETVVCPMNDSMKKRVYGFVEKHINAGGRAYIVCPLIENSEDPSADIAAAVCEYINVSAHFGENITSLLHGKMSAAEKERAMTEFASGEKKILVTTTVVEVGVDVPEATLMVIENADRFGLAQLHQLRGRVGRGEKHSFCVLMSGTDSEKSKERLSMMKNERDGMKLAEYDLKTRGPGDFLGVRQSGEPLFELAEFATEEMIQMMCEE